MTAPDPALTARAEAAYPGVAHEIQIARAAFIAGALSEREARDGADLNAELAELRVWKANAQITLHDDLSRMRKLEGMIVELRIRISNAQALAHKPGAHKEHVLAALDSDDTAN